MNRIKKLVQNIKDNAVDYYTALILVIAIPAVIATMFGWQIGLLVSFIIQVILGVFSLRGSK